MTVSLRTVEGWIKVGNTIDAIGHYRARISDSTH
jgi:hypothetical protein